MEPSQSPHGLQTISQPLAPEDNQPLGLGDIRCSTPQSQYEQVRTVRTFLVINRAKQVTALGNTKLASGYQQFAFGLQQSQQSQFGAQKNKSRGPISSLGAVRATHGAYKSSRKLPRAVAPAAEETSSSPPVVDVEEPTQSSDSQENLITMATISENTVFPPPHQPCSKPDDNRDCNYQRIATLSGHKKSISVVKFSPCGGYLATASADRSIKLWSMKDLTCERTILGHQLGINDISWNSSSQYIASGSDDMTVRIFSVSSGHCWRIMKGHTHYVFSCAFNPQTSLVVSGGYDETVRLWNVITGMCVRLIPAHTDPVTCVAFNHDGSCVASSSYEGCIRVWDVSNGHCLKTLKDLEHDAVSFVEFTPNGKFILSSHMNSKIKMWDVSKEKPVKYYSGHQNSKYCIFAGISLSHGRRVISGSEDGKIFVWDLQTKRVIQVMEEHTKPVLATDAHPILNMMASGGIEPDNTVRIWYSDK
ncbi:Protein CBR-WDR-5.3 [Caenorhabditis briggsae]|uniref:Protein CBR-WDR-5.3 n=2 Tax=Caenorhabditis briggsae TaxID=6238 RepID=A8X8H8_CAEBR|nr:Protein CBR-WDR-5.3 [Caenorhabditis briggsae]CAP28939.2 Protein CBR-WDR-5.3 [Caenorhabditis briggsae]